MTPPAQSKAAGTAAATTAAAAVAVTLLAAGGGLWRRRSPANDCADGRGDGSSSVGRPVACIYRCDVGGAAMSSARGGSGRGSASPCARGGGVMGATPGAWPPPGVDLLAAAVCVWVGEG
jgi:hypothetical protein